MNLISVLQHASTTKIGLPEQVRVHTQLDDTKLQGQPTATHEQRKQHSPFGLLQKSITIRNRATKGKRSKKTVRTTQSADPGWFLSEDPGSMSKTVHSRVGGVERTTLLLVSSDIGQIKQPAIREKRRVPSACK